MADGQSVGRLGSSAEGAAIGIARLDRVREALDKRASIRAGEAELTVRLPSWATYTWPAPAGVEDA
jgi:folate-binding Fe-S cluster repair protein YgfZ